MPLHDFVYDFAWRRCTTLYDFTASRNRRVPCYCTSGLGGRSGADLAANEDSLEAHFGLERRTQLHSLGVADEHLAVRIADGILQFLTLPHCIQRDCNTARSRDAQEGNEQLGVIAHGNTDAVSRLHAHG